MSILRRKRPFSPDEEEAAAASASEEDELASSPARRTRSLSRRDGNGNPNGDGGTEGRSLAGNANCKGGGREGSIVGNPNCKGGVGENPNCKGKREENPVRNPNCEGKPVGNPNCEGKSVGNPNCEGKPFGNPNSEGKLVGNPNCEEKPVGNPNCKGKREGKPVENQGEKEEEPVENQGEREEEPVENPNSKGKSEEKPAENPNSKGKSEEKPAENPNFKGKRVAKPVENPNSKGNREGKPAENPNCEGKREEKPAGNPDCEGKWEGKSVESPNCEGKREKKPAGNSNCKGGGRSGSGSDIETLSDWVQQCIKMEKQKKKKRRLEDLDGNIQKTCDLLYSRKVQRLPRTTTDAASAAFHDESQQTMDFICKMEGLNLHVNLLGLECAQENSVGYGGSLQNSIENGESLQKNSVGHGRSLRNSVGNGGSVQKNSVENGESLQKNSVGDGRSLRNSVRNGGSVRKNSVESGDTLQKNFFRDGQSLQNSVQNGGSMQKNSVKNGESLQKNSIGNDGSLQKNSVSNGGFIQKSSFRSGGILQNSLRNGESLRKNSVGNGRYLRKNSVRNEESLHKNSVRNGESLQKNSIKNGEFSQKNSVENGGSLQIYSIRNAESLQKSSVGNGRSFGVTTRFKNRESQAVNQTVRSSLGMSVCIESVEPQADDPMKDSCSEFLVDCGLPHTNVSLQASPHANSVLACPQEEEGKEEEEEERRIKSTAKSSQLGKMLIPEGNSDLTKSQDIEAVAKEAEERLKLMDGRRCGLCGGGSNGELPERLASIKHKEGGGQANKVGKSQASSRPFVMEPGWLGRLLGPLDDRFGIAGVWVHQECAIWTPEVYFSGIGHLRNVRAALRRGRRLRCSRCGRRGATIGCRVDKCTRTYHLPCGYFEGGLFDHKKYLMACAEHAFMFLPRSSRSGSSEKGLVHSKIQYQSMVAERKKEAQKALLRDAEAEEKWMENAGVDEEFVRRESKRLRRNLQMLAPVFVGRNEGGRNISSGWETVAGLQSVVQCLKEMVILPLLYPEAFNKLGISAPRGVLLHGSPGTGKTHIVKALVGACAKGGERIAYFSRKGADCLGKYVGDAERQLRLLFHLAERHQPAIIFFDEIDGLAPKRSHHHHDQTQKSVVSTLLALMDGLCPRGAVVVIGATNRPGDLDPALRRPGRFDREVHFPLPSLCDRAAILALRTKKWETPPPKEVLYFLAKGTPGYAGADLQALCAEAAMVAIRRVVPLMNLLHNKIPSPSLPALNVRVSDWVAALKQAPTPCSHRLGRGAAYEDLNPLPRYMVPLLIKPMAELLISLYLDPRVMLPPPLESSTKLIHGLLSSTTEGYQIGHWKHKLQLQVMSSSKALEDALSTNGMLFGKDTDFRKLSENQQGSSYSGSSFRMMLSGDRMNGQSLFAPWILYGFSGYAEILKLSLAAMLQEGCGDAIQGLLKLLGEVKLTHPCVLYLPQIESWAVEIAELDNGRMEQIASQSWNLFVQQMSLMPVDIPIIILASCELQKGNLPIEISRFFGEDLPDVRVSINTPSLYCAPVPSIWVEMGTFIDTPAIFERAAEHYAFFFSQRFLCAARSFSRSSKDLSQQCLYRNDLYSKEESFGALEGKNPENKEDKALHEVTFRTDIDGSSMSRPSDVSVAISNCGLQLIFHPELAELRHATLRLKESPHACSRKNKKKLRFLWGDGHGDSTGKVVTGLAAVGLLAHNGLYLTAMELALEVRKVLDLLKRAVSMKVQRGKDRFLYFRILSQAAALDDKMFAWAHHLQRWEMNLGKFHRDEGRALDSIRGSGQQIDEASSGSELRLEANFKAFSGEGRSNKDDDHVLPKTLQLSDSMNSNEGKIKDIANSNTALKFKRSSQSSSRVSSQIRNVKFNAAKDLFPKLWKCCPQCEDEIAYTLKDAFQALLGRGKFRKSSADDIHDVIGICVAAVSKALSKLLCTLNQTKGALNKDESPTTGHICLAGASCGRENKCAIRMSEMTVEAKNATFFLCLCPLLEAISNMLCFLEC